MEEHKKNILNTREILAEWLQELNVFYHQHQIASNIHYRNYYLFGVPVIVLSTLVGTTRFRASTSLILIPNSFCGIH